MNNNVYALIRVSTKDQKEDRQVERMTKIGISKSNIVIEKESGKSTVRAKYHKLVKLLKKGDTLYIENIDRLGRDYDIILSEWRKLTKQKEIIIKVLDTPILDTDQVENSLLGKLIRDIILHIQAFQAESEWDKIKIRQAQGIAVAKANGKNLGRPKSERTEKEIKVANQYLKGEILFDTALSVLNIKKTAFYNLCRIIGEKD
ncbi:MAG: recombinase family protein [Lachnospiraceae bacterium]|nr:recombinase family protein [Lachnospiraceae bacterium]